MKNGKVWLVGAGPSDISLLTIKAYKVIKNADVIIYDRLVSHSVIQLKKDDAILINVGKRANKHTMKQEDINTLLLQYAKNGKDIVRLKGGDPFLFGRGGEELLLLAKNGIEFEVINGITSPIALPTYAGIPVTHRDFASSLHIITGHKKENEILDIDFDALVKAKGTLIFLMGISSLNMIQKGLLDANMKANTPVAIIENGTTAKQRNIIDTLDNICKTAKEKKVKTPAIIVVGEVCNLSKIFDWRSKLPLYNERILVTRPKDTNSTLCEKLRENGGEVIEIPSIITIPILDEENKNIYENIQKYKYIVFTSVKGVKYFFDELIRYKIDIRKLINIKIATVGKTTKEEIEKKGIFVDIIPSIYSAENLALEIKEDLQVGDNVLIARALEGNLKFVDILMQNGIKTTDLSLYKTIYKDFEFINYEYDYNDIVIFTSASTVKGFINAVEKYKLNYSDITALCIGVQTQKEAKLYNMKTFVSNEATIDSLVCKMIEISNEKGEVYEK